MQKHVYEDLPEVLFQEERLLRFIREEFTTIVHDMKRAGYFDSLEIVGSWSLARAVKRLIDGNLLEVCPNRVGLSKLKKAIEGIRATTGPMDTPEEVVDTAVMCVLVLSKLLEVFGDRIVSLTKEEVEKFLEA